MAQASECHVSLGPPEVWLSKQYICTQTSPLFSSLQHICIIKVSNAVRDAERIRPYQKMLCCKASIKKRKCYLLLCHILSFVLIFPFAPVTCYFLLKQRFEIECSQTFCVDRIHKSFPFRLSAAQHFGYRCFDSLWS